MDAIPTLGQINIYIGILNPEAGHYTIIIHLYCFVHPIFRFWFLVTFGDKITKIRKYYVIFVYILQGKMSKTEKNRKENHPTKVTKIPKTKRRKYGMNETIIE